MGQRAPVFPESVCWHRFCVGKTDPSAGASATMTALEPTAFRCLPAAHVASWAQAHALSPSDIDCATTVMLKILDGKCKMGAVDKVVMEQLYDAVKTRPGLRLGEEFHRLIASSRGDSSEALKNFIYEKRVLAETTISRPVMKAFKAMIRQEGLFDGMAEEGNASVLG